ncbi:hypothetical protein [Burkholderia sp. LS-044]|uniref:hypothetical protein n=1 Tax=Burkholderia sp. LS-044 TaxID=1459967 RepID=UPI001455F236|nr:hypothetical protein [Burkholderia sp. LS-044]
MLLSACDAGIVSAHTGPMSNPGAATRHSAMHLPAALNHGKKIADITYDPDWLLSNYHIITGTKLMKNHPIMATGSDNFIDTIATKFLAFSYVKRETSSPTISVKH